MSAEGLRTLPSLEQIRRRDIHDARRQRIENNVFLGRNYARNPVKVMYSAGRWDVEPITIPSVQAVAIVDLMPLLFSAPRRKNKYSSIIHSQLEANNGHYLLVPHLLENPLLVPKIQKEFMDKLKQSFDDQAGYVVSGRGYEFGRERKIKRIQTDSFVNVLAGLAFWGADLNTVRVGKFGDDFRVQCELDGVTKTIIFHQARVDASFRRRGSDNYRWAQIVFDGFDAGTTAVLVKADSQKVSGFMVNAVNPDVVYGTRPDMRGIEPTLQQSYILTERNSLSFPHPEEKFGYSTIATTQVAYRRSA